MQHILGVTFRDNEAELMDDDGPGTNAYSFMGLQRAISEAQKRMAHNSNIVSINIYRIIQELPGQSKYQVVQRLP